MLLTGQNSCYHTAKLTRDNMNEDYIVTIYYVIDEMLNAVEYQDDGRSCISAGEVLTVAIVAARYFHNH